jgi:hypothetical protein
MSIISKLRLATVTESRMGPTQFSATVNEVRNQAKATAHVTVFLSHSHADTAQIDRVAVLLRRTGVSIYIDRTDSGMPPTTGADTAARIKQKIREHKKFILVATDNAITSKWCNWELGYGDALKFDSHIALLPLSENSGSWTGTEYLKIYPRIEESPSYPETYIVIYPNGRQVALAAWLQA